MRAMVDPRLPTEEEVEHRKLTRLTYRNWCPERVKAKGKDLDHKRGSRQREEIVGFLF